MRFGIIPTNPIDRLVLKLNLVPEPMVMTQLAFTMARAIMAGVEVGIFDALADDSLTAAAIAKKCSTDLKATQALLGALVGSRNLKYSKKDQTYSLTKVTRKWLLRQSEHSLSNKMIFQRFEWEALGRLDEYLRTGKPLDLHNSESSSDTWATYQAGMVDIGRLVLPEVLSRTPVPKNAERMLDIGGSGGTYSAAFLKKYPRLTSKILDLPSAVVHAKPFVEKHKLGNRLEINAGNILTDDIGKETYDFIFMANVAHHLSTEQNEAVARKAFAALRKGGVYLVMDFERSEIPSESNQLGSLMDLYFSFTSQSGTWTCTEMQSWFKKAGFKVEKPIRLRASPGTVQVWGRKI